ncbi:hypothetical protein [Streptomyces sp. JB150]|uniref:hypothetical protein n=1 Tax=Streptomyces sp. JB150 TaxID=2714844 RepID=UPI001F0D1A5D|nr:hypothetical protein [Streptomyces sp. JB150]
MAGRIVRWGSVGAVLGLGMVWWWAVLRMAVAPDAGVLEGTVAAGGWGLSLLPVHAVSKTRAVGALATGRWRAAWRGVGSGAGSGAGAEGGGVGDAGAGCGGGAGEGSSGSAGAGCDGEVAPDADARLDVSGPS